MLAVDESLDELIERLVAQRDVRTAEGRDDLDAGALEGFALEDDDGGEAHEAGLTDDIDLGVVLGFERRDAVAAPVREPFVEPRGVLGEQRRVELVTPDDESAVAGDAAQPDPWNPLAGHRYSKMRSATTPAASRAIAGVTWEYRSSVMPTVA